MDILDEGIVKLFPPRVVEALGEYLKDNALQEIRLKIEKPIIITSSKGEVVLSYILGREDIKYILQRISNYSLYAYEEEIRQGFITIRGGHRVGLAGECVMDNGKVKTIRNISSLIIRICREILGCSKKVMKYIVEDKKVLNTLIISPPKCGKTTILRDIARNLSDGGKKISIIDERSEIAASYLGVPQMKVGIRTDVLDNCFKRSLLPEIIICDEIGTLKDIEALIMAFNSGVNIIVTLHGESIDDLTNRSVFKELLENNVVERVILLSNREGVGTVENVYSLSKGGEKKWSRLYW